MRVQTTLALTAAAAFLVAITALLMAESRTDGGRASGDNTGTHLLVRENSRLIGSKGSSAVTFVEFLGFEVAVGGTHRDARVSRGARDDRRPFLALLVDLDWRVTR